MVGENAVPLATAGDQVKVSAPPPLSIVVKPIQTTEFVAEAVTIGKGFTVTEIEARLVLVHPVKVFVPLTE